MACCAPHRRMVRQSRYGFRKSARTCACVLIILLTFFRIGDNQWAAVVAVHNTRRHYPSLLRKLDVLCWRMPQQQQECSSRSFAVPRPADFKNMGYKVGSITKEQCCPPVQLLPRHCSLVWMCQSIPSMTCRTVLSLDPAVPNPSLRPPGHASYIQCLCTAKCCGYVEACRACRPIRQPHSLTQLLPARRSDQQVMHKLGFCRRPLCQHPREAWVHSAALYETLKVVASSYLTCLDSFLCIADWCGRVKAWWACVSWSGQSV